jgi:uncharacterized membrane protein
MFSISRIKGLIMAIGGLVFMILGLGMWHSPRIDWEGFVAAWSLVIGDIARLFRDPFALLGAIVLVVGLVILISGIRHAWHG